METNIRYEKISMLGSVYGLYAGLNLRSVMPILPKKVSMN